MNEKTPAERMFQGGDTVAVDSIDVPGKEGYVNLTFDDDTYSLEVPRELFTILER